MTRDDIKLPPYLCASYEGDDLFTGDQLVEVVRAAVLAEREAVLEKNNLTWVANCQHLVNAEREACAQVCEAWGSWIGDGHLVANAIRARGQRSG